MKFVDSFIRNVFHLCIFIPPPDAVESIGGTWKAVGKYNQSHAVVQ